MLEKLFVIEDGSDGTWYVSFGEPIQGNMIQIDEQTAREITEAKK